MSKLTHSHLSYHTIYYTIELYYVLWSEIWMGTVLTPIWYHLYYHIHFPYIMLHISHSCIIHNTRAFCGENPSIFLKTQVIDTGRLQILARQALIQQHDFASGSSYNHASQRYLLPFMFFVFVFLIFILKNKCVMPIDRNIDTYKIIHWDMFIFYLVLVELWNYIWKIQVILSHYTIGDHDIWKWTGKKIYLFLLWP